MTHINDHRVSKSSDSSPSIRLETSSNSDFNLSNTNLFALVIIDVSNIFELEMAYGDSLDKETSPDGSSHDTLISENHIRSNHAINYVLVPSVVVEDSSFNAFDSPEV